MRFSFFFILILIILPLHLYSQNRVLIEGTIKTKNQEPISQVLVAIDGANNGVYANDKGYYSLIVLPGKYTVKYSILGFKVQKKNISIDQNITLNITLEEQSTDLAAINIYGKTKSRQLKESSLSVNSLDINKNTSSINALASTIGRSNGIRIRENGGVGSDFDLSINGLSGNSIRYFIDGIPLSTIGNGISIANFPVNIVERVDIYKGVIPIQFGVDALGGVINIITKNQTKNYIDASVGIGYFNTYKADFNTQYINPKTGIFIQASTGFNYSKNNYKMRGVEVWNTLTSSYENVDVKRFHDDYSSFLSQIKAGVRKKTWTDIFSITASLSYVDKQIQTGSVQSVVYGKAKRKNKSYNIAIQYSKKDFFVKNLNADLYLSHTWDNTIVVDTAFRKYRWDGSYTESSRNEITGYAKSIRRTKRPLTINRSYFSYSINDYHSLHFNYLLEHLNNNRSDDVDLDFTPTKDVFSKHTFGFSYDQNFWNDRLSNSFFIKDYISNLKVEQKDLYWITGTNEISNHKTTNNFGYGLSSRYRLSTWFAIKASFEHTYRLPLAKEILGNSTSVYPNLTLRPENSNNFNLGIFGSVELTPKHNIYYETGFFYRKVKDYIRLNAEVNNLSQYQNLENVNVKGLEGEIRYNYNNQVELIANMTYLNEKNKTKYLANGNPEVTYNDQIPNKPWLYSNVELNLKQRSLFGIKDNQLKFSYYFQYVHSFYYRWKAYGTLASKGTIPTQYLHSTSLTYSLKQEKYNISLECNNIFNRLVYDNYMMQKPGRYFFCKLRVFIN